LEPVPPPRIALETLPQGAERGTFLAAYRKFDTEYFSFLAACAWCIWHCGMAQAFLPVKDTCRKVLDFSEHKKEWQQNTWVDALRDPDRSRLGGAACENLNFYLTLLLDPVFRSRFPRTSERVDQTFAISEAQKAVWMFVLNVFSDAISQNFFAVTDRDELTSHQWTLLESEDETLRSAGRHYDARLKSVVIRSLHLAGDSAHFNERCRV
jgi:hypothetical protein